MSTPQLVACGRVPGPPASPVCPLINFGDRPLHAFGLADGSVAIQLLRVRRTRVATDAMSDLARRSCCSMACHTIKPPYTETNASSENVLAVPSQGGQLLCFCTIARLCVWMAASA